MIAVQDKAERGRDIFGEPLPKQFIIEMGSGNSCRNDIDTVRKMIDAVDLVDSGVHDVVFKWQLFTSAPPNRPLKREVFDYAYNYAADFGYETTASVFDEDSLEYLSKFDVPFIKIACREHLYGLVLQILTIAYVSVPEPMDGRWPGAVQLCCVPEYPAELEDYEKRFPDLRYVSDHTPGWELYWKHDPDIIEKHFVLKREAGNPDAGPFAVTPEQLSEVL